MVDALAGGGVWPNSGSHAVKRQHVNFSVGSEIGACGCVGRCFRTRLPLEGRSERGVPVGVLVGRNGGRRTISSEKVARGRVFRRWLWVAEIDHAVKP